MRLKESCFLEFRNLKADHSFYSLLQPPKGPRSELNLSKMKVNIALGTNTLTVAVNVDREKDIGI